MPIFASRQTPPTLAPHQNATLPPPDKCVVPAGYAAQRAALSPARDTARSEHAPRATPAPTAGKHAAQSAALSPARQRACLAAHQTQGRADWLRAHGVLEQVATQPLAGPLAQVRSTVCDANIPVSDEAATRWVDAVATPVRALERHHDTREADQRKATDGPILAAEVIRTGANVISSVAEAGLGPLGCGLGYVRHMAGAAASEVFEGDGEFSAADAGLESLAWGANHVAGSVMARGLTPALTEGFGDAVKGAVAGHVLDLPRSLLTAHLVSEKVKQAKQAKR